MIPVGYLGNPGNPICPHIISVVGCVILDFGWLAIDLGVKIRNLLTGWPECDEGLARVFDGRRICDGEAIEDKRNVIHGANVIRVSILTLRQSSR